LRRWARISYFREHKVRAHFRSHGVTPRVRRMMNVEPIRVLPKGPPPPLPDSHPLSGVSVGQGVATPQGFKL
jgi:hypothetical protein